MTDLKGVALFVPESGMTVKDLANRIDVNRHHGKERAARAQSFNVESLACQKKGQESC